MLKVFFFPFTQGNAQFISRARVWHHKFPPELLSPVMWGFRPLGLRSNSYNGEVFPHEEIATGKLHSRNWLCSQQREVSITFPQHWGPAHCCAHNKLARRWTMKSEAPVPSPREVQNIGYEELQDFISLSKGLRAPNTSDCSDLQREALGKRDCNSAFTRRSCYYPQMASWHCNICKKG